MALHIFARPTKLDPSLINTHLYILHFRIQQLDSARVYFEGKQGAYSAPCPTDWTFEEL
jgi:hypothetical protein